MRTAGAGPGRSRTVLTAPPDLSGLPDVDPRWSRLVEVADADGVPHQWHLLDNGA